MILFSADFYISPSFFFRSVSLKMKNLLTALLCRLLVAAFCSSSLSSSVVEAAPRELEDGGGGGGGADKGKDANKTTRPNEPSGDAG